MEWNKTVDGMSAGVGFGPGLSTCYRSLTHSVIKRDPPIISIDSFFHMLIIIAFYLILLLSLPMTVYQVMSYGGTDYYPYNTMYEYFLNNQSLLLHSPLAGNSPGPRAFHSMAYIESTDSLIIYGGYKDVPDASPLPEMWKYFIQERRWEAIAFDLTDPVTPPLLAKHSMLYMPSANELYFFGGSSDSNRRKKFSNGLFKLSLDDYRWTRITPSNQPPEPRGVSILTAVLDGTGSHRGLIVYTGCGNDDEPLGDIQYYDLSK